MAVTLSSEQFAELLASSNANSKTKKFNKTDLDNRTEAMDINTFVENIDFGSVNRLITMELPDYITSIIIRNIDTLENEQMPFICSNFQTKSYYYKENGVWIKGIEFMTKIYKAIYRNALTQIQNPKYNECINVHDDNDDGEIERKYEASPNNEKQQILHNLCNPDKYPFQKCVQKVLLKLGKRLKC